jgi:hypothetical protein
MRVGVALAAALAFAASARAESLPAPPTSPQPTPRELYQQLNDLRINPSEVYRVKDLAIRRDELRLSLLEGKLAFFQPAPAPNASERGRVTGAVFLGRGHALALPRDPVEKQQMARFLGAPLLDQWFVSAYFRFTDATAEELREQLRAGKFAPQEDAAFADYWNGALAQLNQGHSLRILQDLLSEKPQAYFYAGLEGVATGPFDLLIDDRREEQVLLGQVRTVGAATFYDVWASYPRRDAPPMTRTVAPLKYAIEATVFPDRMLEGTTTIRLRVERGGERVIPLDLSRFLAVQSVERVTGTAFPAQSEMSWVPGEALPFFQNEDVRRRDLATRGNDAVLVVLPAAPKPGEEFALRLHYKGSVIGDAGNGVLFVGDRGSWYPHTGGFDSFAPYEMTLRWPRRLKLVATGAKLEEKDDGEFKVGRWSSEQPVAVAGFNLGEYSSAAVTDKGVNVEVYANRQLEQALQQRLAPTITTAVDLPPLTGGRRVPQPLEMPVVTPSPADALRELGRDVASSIKFYEKYSGPFPYRQLNVAQIPGTFGQGWPGLLYLSTFSFLPPEAQRRAGLTTAGQEHFSELVPFHEVAHQWWGNLVGWGSYRDQWIDEAIANYMALLFADSRKEPDRSLRHWLERYRARLTVRIGSDEETADEIGPLVLGNRLVSSKSPNGFERVIYGKGAWVIHMLRMMLRQPGRDPDARFNALLTTLVTKYRYRALTTADLRREVEAVMTPAMDLEGGRSMEWFFEQWVRGTGIPRYHLEFTAKKLDSGYLVRGTLEQRAVPKGFVAPVPIYAISAGKFAYLGTVVTNGEKTPFHFVLPNAPQKLQIDPQMTLLCLVD